MSDEMAGQCKYSCNTAAETLEWINAIVHFLRPYSFLINAHVVNFFTDRLWEAIDKEWIDCLRHETVENLLLIPSGVVQDDWPASLKKFILTLRSLVFPREQADLQMVLPGLHMTSLNSVLSQGMNLKKKHEVEVLSAIVSSIANSVRAHTIIDVGAGQGYLAQVLSFQYGLSVIAIDACSHHGKVTNARAERIKKHYTTQMRKSQSGNRNLNIPRAVTCRVMSTDMLKALSDTSLLKEDVDQENQIGKDCEKLCGGKLTSLIDAYQEASLVLAGLHACGDLSVTMLKSFLECKEVKAMVSIGCCYNLLSEEGYGNASSQCGFPMSNGVKFVGLSLGKSSRDLACQSAERWRSLGKDAGLHNFELHAFRAAFQMVLFEYYPEVLITSPSIGRQGKTLRRQQQQRILESPLHNKDSSQTPLAQKHSKMKGCCPTMKSAEFETVEKRIGVAPKDDKSSSGLDTDALLDEISSNKGTRYEGTESVDKYSLFEKFCRTGLSRLGLKPLEDINFLGLWQQAGPFTELIGPYWSLRAALGPLLETFILLDRLLFLQEQGSSLEAIMLPIFNPVLSPRNVAIIARRI